MLLHINWLKSTFQVLFIVSHTFMKACEFRNSVFWCGMNLLKLISISIYQITPSTFQVQSAYFHVVKSVCKCFHHCDVHADSNIYWCLTSEVLQEKSQHLRSHFDSFDPQKWHGIIQNHKVLDKKYTQYFSRHCTCRWPSTLVLGHLQAQWWPSLYPLGIWEHL